MMSRPLPPLWVWLILPLRLAGVLGVVLIHFVFGSLLLLLPMDSGRKSLVQASWVVFLCTLLRLLFGLRVKVEGASTRADRPLLVVANHVSFLDILAMTAWRPLSYISSMDMAEAPFVGWVLRSTGTILVERRRRSALNQDNEQVVAALKNGAPVCLYPEGTSTDGSEILKFKSGLLESAFVSQASVMPVLIQYDCWGGAPVTRANHLRICFPAAMGIVEHILNIATNPGIQARLKILPPIAADGSRTRRELAEELRDRLLAEFKPIV